MLIGVKQKFAIECYHYPLSSQVKHIFGHMCLWIDGVSLGDLDETDCMLNVTEGCLSDIVFKLDQLENNEFNRLSDVQLYSFLDQKLYSIEERNADELCDNSKKYYKFNFLTNGGESFDKTKSFVVTTEKTVRLLFTDSAGVFHSATIQKEIFLSVILSFFEWIKNERQYKG